MQYILLGISIYSILSRGTPTVVITPEIRQQLILAMFQEPGEETQLKGISHYSIQHKSWSGKNPQPKSIPNKNKKK
jgi:hypothetical protein